ncbi:MAG: endolytic transglycosylase MltG [Chloroflexi bacterium]|nr:endolytic transglycosylase MltG [Chloroflexota bacterium]
MPPALAVLLASCQSGADVLGYFVDRLDTPASTDSKSVSFTVEPGDNAETIARNLEEKKLVKSASVFRFLVLYYGVDKDLKAGEYELRPSNTSSEVIAKLSHGTVRSTTVTIPEGWRMEEIAQLLEKKGIFEATEFLGVAREGKFEHEFLASRPEQSSLEGFLFPDTYRVPSRFNAEDFINRMLKNFDTRLPAAVRQKAAPQGMSLYEVLTLASIVEREAVLAAERPVIASVFLNRLRAGVRLAADPTVQYALTTSADSVAKNGYWKTELTSADLEVKSPYNTYRNQGLPPGPISNPGLASIMAVLEPATTDYLFFVARSDGSHAFSVTFEEHARNARAQGR